jgi:hypothetical protein
LHPLIITHLIGGLGNQMFQYACARRLASTRNTTLKLDLTGFETYDLREYALDGLQISAEIATAAEVRRFQRRERVEARVPRWLWRALPGGRHTIVKERSFAFDAETFNMDGNLLLEGYWQSEKYFADIADLLWREFSLRRPPDSANAALAELIGKVNAVSIHVRRGDYVTNPTTHQGHGVCSVDYYERALQTIVERDRDPHLFVFSDDPKWAKDCLRFPFPTVYVEGNMGEKHCQDLWLMSLCRQNIIANSSFSWWAAWLNRNPDKAVIAPARWFNVDSMDTRDLLPAAWVKL